MSGDAKILVVDDDQNMRTALEEALTRCGYSVDTASDGVSGMNKVEVGDYKLVVADIRMPKKTGLELLEEIKKSRPAIAVVLITAYGTVETAVEAMKKGADDYLLKPFSVDALENIIRRVIGGESQEPSRIPQKLAPAAGTTKANGRPIITRNKKMMELLDMVERTAPSKAAVFVHGESGTGKELIARYVHQKSDRADGPFVAVNCAALPESLLESELFGHEKGAFTGAVNRKLGKFELANHGSILLDEITEMDAGLQAKLLRVLQEKEVDRVGGTAPVPVDVRVISTTNRKVDQAISDGTFREDLYFRLNVIPVTLPPLRERMDDLPELIDYFINKFSAEAGVKTKKLEAQTMDILRKCRWKGNVRELENVMERAVLLSRSDTISPEDLFLSDIMQDETEKRSDITEVGGTVEEMERKLILGTLEKVGDNRTRAAEMLGISIRTLRNKLNDYKQRQKDE